jgi:AcrR family transcriptional regulator
MPRAKKSTIRKKAGKQRGPGRPEGETFARERIKNAAEVVFSELGFARASTGEIAARAKVTQALVNYYFGSKERLFKEVYARRANEIVKGRLERLHTLTKSGKPFTLSQVLSAYLEPAFAIRRTRGGRAFLRLQWRLLHSEPPRFGASLRGKAYDDSAREFVSAIRKIVPQLSEKTAYWRIVFVIGTYAYMHSDTHRLEQISRGACSSNDLEEMLEQAKAFVLGGMIAPDAQNARDAQAARDAEAASALRLRSRRHAAAND